MVNFNLLKDLYICIYDFVYIFIWQHWVLAAAFRLFFSTCSKEGLLSSCSARASHCGDFSCCGAQALWHTASIVAAPGL